MGLKPLLRKVWARKGERPRAVVARRYQWFHVCSFVEPEGGASLSLLADWDGQHGDALGGAGSGGVARLPAGGGAGGVDLEYLPPCSPELQPAEGCGRW